MREQEQKYKKIMIMVNDEPIGKEIWIDKITYAPVNFNELTPTQVPLNEGSCAS